MEGAAPSSSSTVVQMAIVVAIVVIASAAGDDTARSTSSGPSAQCLGEVAKVAESQQESFDVELEVETFESAEAARAADRERRGGRCAHRRRLDHRCRRLRGAGRARPAGVAKRDGAEELAGQGLPTTDPGCARAGAADRRGGRRGVGAGVAFISSLLLYVAIIGSGYAVATGVVEEKSSRVVEVDPVRDQAGPPPRRQGDRDRPSEPGAAARDRRSPAWRRRFRLVRWTSPTRLPRRSS